MFKKLTYLTLTVLILVSSVVMASCDSIDTDMLPATDDTYNIGSALLRWHDIRYGGTLYGGNAWFTDIDVSGDIDVAGDVNVDGSVIRTDGAGGGGYWHEYNLPAFNVSPGASGATFIAPNVSSLGGWRLDNITELLYFATHVEDDWDGTTDALLEIAFEVNIDNTGGLITDTVEISVECFHKIEGAFGCTVVSTEGSVVVGQSDQHELFIMDVPFDAADLAINQIISIRINLNTIMSEVDSIIVNYFEFKYQTFIAAMEAP